METVLAERNRAIAIMAQHMPYRTIAAQFGISSSRVGQIVTRLGPLRPKHQVLPDLTNEELNRVAELHADYERLVVLARELCGVVELIEAMKVNFPGNSMWGRLTPPSPERPDHRGPTGQL